MEQLKPCPFCGGEAYLLVGNGVIAYCSTCNIQTESLCDGKNSATGKPYGNAIKVTIETWNRRVQCLK